MFEKPHVLLIEDSEETQIMVESLLSSICYLKIVDTTVKAEEEINKKLPDLIIADIGLPGENGFQFCARIRSNEKFNDIPFIFFTSNNQPSDEVMGLKLGADDYLKKPIDHAVFTARVTSILRKKQDRQNTEKILQVGELSINFSKQKAFIVSEADNSSTDLGLTYSEFRILVVLAENQGFLFSRETLLSKIWGDDISVSDRTIDTHIYKLRRKLGKLSWLISTTSGVGYKFDQNKM